MEPTRASALRAVQRGFRGFFDESPDLFQGNVFTVRPNDDDGRTPYEATLLAPNVSRKHALRRRGDDSLRPARRAFAQRHFFRTKQQNASQSARFHDEHHAAGELRQAPEDEQFQFSRSGAQPDSGARSKPQRVHRGAPTSRKNANERRSRCRWWKRNARITRPTGSRGNCPASALDAACNPLC